LSYLQGRAFENADPNGEMKLADLIAELKDSEAIASHIDDRNPGEAQAGKDAPERSKPCPA
jgi:hypothetical protein